MLAIRYLTNGFWPHHFELMTMTDKIEYKESRLRAVHAVGTSSLLRGPGPRRSQMMLVGVEASRGSVLGPLGSFGTIGFAARPIEKKAL